MQFEGQNPEFIIRDCTMQDVEAIADIYNESISAGDASMDDVLKTGGYYREQIANFNKREAILVLEEKNQILGWGIIKRYSEREGYRFCCETAVYLRRNQLRRGLGSKIKLALIDRCREYGYHHLVAKIFASNIASIEYNKKLGYDIVGVQNEIGFKNGQWQDVVIMQLILRDTKPVISEKYL